MLNLKFSNQINQFEYDFTKQILGKQITLDREVHMLVNSLGVGL